MNGLDQLMSSIRALAEEAESRTRQDAARVSQLLNFDRGYQWGHAHAHPFLHAVEQHPDAERPKLNMSRRLISAFSSMISNSVNSFVVSARNGSSMAELQAMHTDAIVHALWRDDGYFPLEERARAVGLASKTGGCWVKVVWDPEKGVESGDDGDLDVRVLTRNQVHPDPTAADERDISYMFETEILPVAKAISRYPTDHYGRATGSQSFDRTNREAEFYQSSGIDDFTDFTWTQGGDASRNYAVKVTKCYWKPSRQFPEGLFVAYSGQTVLSVSVLQFDWPFVFFAGPHPIEGQLYGDGLLMDLEHPQRSMNEVFGRILEWIKNCSAPKMAVQEGTMVRHQAFDDLAGGIVYHTGAVAPGWVNPPAPPGQLFGVVSDMKELMKEISAISEINLGQTPTDDFSGRAVSMLHELQQSSHGASFASFARSCLEVLKKMLGVAQRYWPDEKALIGAPTMGRNRTVTFRRVLFDARALIAIDPSTAAARNKMAARAEKVELFTAGAYEENPAALKFRHELQMEGPDALSLDSSHRRKALSENIALKDGNHYPQVDDLDDHEIHWKEHLSGYFEDDLNPQQKTALAQHIRDHGMYLSAMVEEQQAAMGSEGMLTPPPELGPGAESPINGGIGDMEAISASGRSPGPGTDLNEME